MIQVSRVISKVYITVTRLFRYLLETNTRALLYVMWTGRDSNPHTPRCKRGAVPDQLLQP